MDYSEEQVKKANSNKFAGEMFSQMINNDTDFQEFLEGRFDELDKTHQLMAQVAFGSMKVAINDYFVMKGLK